MSCMVFPVPFLLEFLAGSHVLSPGDLIFTGTPAGVGPIRVGDRFDMHWTGGLSGSYSGVF